MSDDVAKMIIEQGYQQLLIKAVIVIAVACYNSSLVPSFAFRKKGKFYDKYLLLVTFMPDDVAKKIIVLVVTDKDGDSNSRSMS